METTGFVLFSTDLVNKTGLILRSFLYLLDEKKTTHYYLSDTTEHFKVSNEYFSRCKFPQRMVQLYQYHCMEEFCNTIINWINVEVHSSKAPLEILILLLGSRRRLRISCENGRLL